MPIYRRLPKRGFNNIFRQGLQRRVAWRVSRLRSMPASSMARRRLMSQRLGCRRHPPLKDGVRVLADGELKAKLTLKSPAPRSRPSKSYRKGRRLDQADRLAPKPLPKKPSGGEIRRLFRRVKDLQSPGRHGA
jgi:hypothetical protein